MPKAILLARPNSSMSSIAQAFGDAQTTIASLAGGIGGATSDAVSSTIIARFGGASQGMGGVGLEFCLRAVVSAGTFGLLRGYMPETSSNIFFSILYFACDRGLLGSAVALSRNAVNAASSTVRAGVSPPPRPAAKVPPANPTANCTKGCQV